MNIKNLLAPALQFVDKNAPVILVAGGVGLAIGASVLSYRAGSKVESVLEEHGATEAPIPQKIAATWTLWLPPVVALAGSATAVAFAHKINAQRLAALGAAAALSEKTVMQYGDKIGELFGREGRDRVETEVIKQHIPADAEEILFLDSYSGRGFKSSIEAVRKAVNDTNESLIHDSYISLNDFYGNLGLEPVGCGWDVGWTTDALIEAQFVPAMFDGKPAVSLYFRNTPTASSWRG